MPIVVVSECRGARVPVRLLTIDIAMWRSYQGLVVLSHLSTSQWMVCSGEHTSILEQLNYAMEDFTCKLFPISVVPLAVNSCKLIVPKMVGRHLQSG